MFSYNLELTSWCFVRRGTLYAFFKDRFWKGDHGFLLVFHSKYSSIIHRFRDYDVFLENRKLRHGTISSRGRCTQFLMTVSERPTGFLFVFHRNCSSIMHRFRDNEVFLQTENDVISISPPGGTVNGSQQRNLEGR